MTDLAPLLLSTSQQGAPPDGNTAAAELNALQHAHRQGIPYRLITSQILRC